MIEVESCWVRGISTDLTALTQFVSIEPDSSSIEIPGWDASEPFVMGWCLDFFSPCPSESSLVGRGSRLAPGTASDEPSSVSMFSVRSHAGNVASVNIPVKGLWKMSLSCSV